MRGLSINNFWNLRPKMPFRYKVRFETNLPGIEDEILTYAVTSINLPKMEGQASEGSLYLGNTIFTVPVWNIASRKLEITFEETDNMLVSRFIDTLNKLSYGKVHWKITIIVYEFEEHMRDYDNNHIDAKATAYVCHLCSYDEPQFKRDGNAAQVTMNASFIIDTIIENWSASKGIITGKTKKQQNSAYNPDLTSVFQSVQNEKFTFGDVKYTGIGGTGDAGDKKKYNSGNSYKDFKVDEMETKAALEHIKDAGFTNITEDKLREVQVENAKRMETAYTKFEKLLAEKGYGVSRSTYNDANHVPGVGSTQGSHLLGSKIDLLLWESNDKKKRLLPQNMSKDDVDFILKAAKEAGFVANWERNPNAEISGWGDFVLADAKTITKDNEIIDIKTHSWTGERKVADSTNTKNRQDIGTK